jgi:hypothetical protein
MILKDMSHLIHCKSCKYIFERLQEKYWTVHDELLEKASKRRCGRCRLLLDKEGRDLLEKKALLQSNLSTLREMKLCKHMSHHKYPDGTFDDGKWIRDLQKEADGVLGSPMDFVASLVDLERDFPKEIPEPDQESKEITPEEMAKERSRIRIMGRPLSEFQNGLPGAVVHRTDTKLQTVHERKDATKAD